MSRVTLVALIFAVLALAGIIAFVQLSPAPAQADSASAQEQQEQTAAPSRSPDVIYVPTPHEVVAEMLKLTKIGKGDVLYDLGSGDGRLVITAAEKYGARGVGIDIDPQRIRESNENAKKAGVEDRVQFLQQDLFETDIREADAVTLYLLPALNVKLRPKLFRELKPGTPIVSHDFDMGDWMPDKTLEVKSSTRTHKVYYWQIPAQAAGEWRWNIGDDEFTLNLTQEFQVVNGEVTVNGRKVGIIDGKLSGDQLEFTLPPEGRSGARRFSGRVNGNQIEGLVRAGGKQMAWNANRTKAGAAVAGD